MLIRFIKKASTQFASSNILSW